MSQSITRAQVVGRQVRAALAEHGLSQTELAQQLGLTIDAMSRRITGRVSFRADELIAIGKVLGVEPARFLRPLPAAAVSDVPAPRSPEEKGPRAGSRGVA